MKVRDRKTTNLLQGKLITQLMLFSLGNVQLSDLFYGSEAEVTCDHGYHVNDTTRPIKCQENGKWNVDVECRLTKCPKRGPLVKKGLIKWKCTF